MPCHAMPCHAMPCHAMPCHAMPCHAIMPQNIFSCFIHTSKQHAECMAGQGRAGQGRAGQGRAGQGRAGQGRAGQGRAGQGRAGQGMAFSCACSRLPAITVINHTWLHFIMQQCMKNLIPSRLLIVMRSYPQTNAISIGLVASRKFLNYKSELLAPAGTFYQAVRA